MDLDHYEIKAGKKAFTYEFTSVGIQKPIRKLVQFSLILKPETYNLSFGDKNPDTSDIDDIIVTNNGDSEKVLATVVSAIYVFCKLLPQARVFATGSTAARTRLGISRYFDIASTDFEIWGLVDANWEHFTKGKNYRHFLEVI